MHKVIMLIFYMNQNRYTYPPGNATEFASQTETVEPCEFWVSR